MPMTVAGLRAALADLPDDMPVVLAKDAEGNGYSPLSDADEAMYLADSTWSGEVYLTDKQLQDKVARGVGGWGPEDAAPDGAVRALVLGPVN